MKGIKYPLQTMFRNTTTLGKEHIVKVSFESKHIHSLTDKSASHFKEQWLGLFSKTGLT